MSLPETRPLSTSPACFFLAALLLAAPDSAEGELRRAKEPADERTGAIVTVRFEPPSAAPILGPRFAPVTFELFLDLTDPTVVRLHDLLGELRRRHPGRVRVIYRLVARGTIRARSNDYVEAGREAFAQGLFEPFLEAYLGSWRDVHARDRLHRAAEAAGLDLDRFQRALAANRHAEAARQDHHRRRRYRVRSVPGFLVNGVPLAARDVRDQGALEEVYQRAYARARDLLDRGVPLPALHDQLLREASWNREAAPPGAGAVDGMHRGERPESGAPPLVPGLLDPFGPHARGPRDAPVVLFFFCSFQSRNCMSMSQVIQDLRDAYRRELRIVFHHLPGGEETGQESARRLHEASLCAAEQTAFWDFHDRIYSRYQRREISNEHILGQLGGIETLDLEELEACLEGARHAEAVETAVTLARDLGITYTPSVVVGGRLYVGTRSFEELSALVDEELSPGVLERLFPPARKTRKTASR